MMIPTNRPLSEKEKGCCHSVSENSRQSQDASGVRRPVDAVLVNPLLSSVCEIRMKSCLLFSKMELSAYF